MAKKQKLDFSSISSKPKLDFSSITPVTKEEQEDQPIKKKEEEDTESVLEDGSLDSQETEEVDYSQVKKPFKRLATSASEVEQEAIEKRQSETWEEESIRLKKEEQKEEEEKKLEQQQAVSYVDSNLTDEQMLSKSTEDLAEDQDTDIYSSDLMFALKGRKNQIINSKSKEYSAELKKLEIDSLLSSGIPENEVDSVYNSTKEKSLLDSGIKTLGLDEEEFKEYGNAIEDYYTLRNKGKERTSSENIKLVELGNKVKQLREDMNTKEFINPETGKIDQEKAEETIKLVNKYEEELKTDQQKFSERYSSERDKLKYLENQLLSMFDEDSKAGIVSSKTIEDIPKFLKGAGLLDQIYMRDEAEEAVNKYKSLYEEYEESKSNFSALSRALLLNEDPSSVSRGLGESDIPYLGAVMNVLGNVVTAGGESLFEEVSGFDIQTDSDFASKISQLANEEGIKITEETAERAKPLLSEKVGAAMGTSVPMMAEIMVNTVIGNKIKGVLGIPKFFSKIKYLQNSPKITKLLDTTIEATQQALAFEFTSSGSAAMGLGEFLGERGFEKAISRVNGKYGKVFKLLGKVVSGGAGATFGEYAGDFAEQSFKKGFLSEASFKETFGRDYDEGLDKFLVTAIMSTAMGAGSQVGSFLSDSQAYYDSIGDTQRSGEIQQLIDANKANDLVAKVKSGEATIEELESVLGSGKEGARKLDDMSPEELTEYAAENDIDLEVLKEEAKNNKDLTTEELTQLTEKQDGKEKTETETKDKTENKDGVLEEATEEDNGLKVERLTKERIAASKKYNDISSTAEPTRKVKDSDLDKTEIIKREKERDAIKDNIKSLEKKKKIAQNTFQNSKEKKIGTAIAAAKYELGNAEKIVLNEENKAKRKAEKIAISEGRKVKAKKLEKAKEELEYAEAAEREAKGEIYLIEGDVITGEKGRFVTSEQMINNLNEKKFQSEKEVQELEDRKVQKIAEQKQYKVNDPREIENYDRLIAEAKDQVKISEKNIKKFIDSINAESSSETKTETKTETKDGVLEEEEVTEETVKNLDETGILDKIDKKESVNNSESEVYTNKIYDLIDSEKVVEGSETESKLYDLIEKVENYERKTKTVKTETTETRLLTRFKQDAGKINRKAFRDQVSGSKSIFRGKEGTVDVVGGKVIFKTKDGSKVLGNTADILTQDFTTNNIIKDSDGNVTGVKIKTPDGEVTINNSEVGLDMGIQLQEKKLGRHPMSDVEAVYSEVLKEESIEVPITKEGVSKTEETIPTTEGDTFTKEDLDTEITTENKQSFLDKLDRASANIKKMSLADPTGIVAIVDGMITLMKKSIEAGITIREAFKQAKAKYKSSQEYKDLSPSDKKKFNSFNEDSIFNPTDSSDNTFSKKEQDVIDTLEDSKEINRSLEDKVIIDSFRKKGIPEIQAKNLVKKYKTSKKNIKKEIREQTGQTDTSPEVVTTQSKVLKDKYKNLTTGEKLGIKKIKQIQKDFSDFINNNKKYINSVSPKITAALLKKVSSINSNKTLEQALDYVDNIVTKEDFRKKEKSRLSKIDKIRKELSSKSLKTKGSKPASGKIDVDSIDMLSKAEGYLDMSKSEASAKMDKILSKYSPEEEISISDIEELNALDYADLDNLSLQELTQLEESTKEFKKEGRESLKLKRQVRKEYRDSVKEKVELAVAPVSEVKNTTSLELSKRKSNLKGKIASKLKSVVSSIKQFGNFNEAWSGLVGSINSLSKKDTGSAESARDFLKEDLIDPVNKASSDKVKAMTSTIDNIREAKKKFFGKNYKKKIKENNKYKPVKNNKGEEIKDSEGNTVTMSNNEAMYIYNLTKDPTLESTLDGQQESNVDDKIVIDAALRVIDSNPELKKYADWVHDSYYPEYYKRVNKEYRKQYDYNLPFNENYSPIYRDGFKQEMNVDNLSPLNNIATTLNGSLKERVSNTKPIKLLNNDIDMVMYRYANQMEQFISTTDVVKNLNSIFSDPKIKQSISQQKGDYMNNFIKKFIEDFARGGMISEDISLSVLSKIRKNFTTATLGLNPPLLVKQLTSAPAYAAQTNTKEYLKQIPQIFSKSGLKDAMKLLNSDFVKDRMSSGFDRDMALALKQDINETLSGSKTLASKAMFLTKWGDIGAIVLGGTPYYRAQKNIYKKKGMSEAKASEKAMLDFEVATKSVQQSANIEEMSTAQRGTEMSKMLTMFKTSPAQYYRQSSSAWRNIANGRATTQDFKKVVMYQFILPALFTAATKGFTGDEEDAGDYIESISAGNLQGLYLAGDIIKHSIDIAKGKPFDYQTTPALSGIVKLTEAVSVAISEGGVSIEDLIDDVLIPTGEVTTGLPLKNAKKLTLGTFNKIGKGQYKSYRDILKLGGYSEYIIDRGFKKSKPKKQRRTR